MGRMKKSRRIIPIPEIKECLDNVLFRYEHVIRASLFGSYATGDATGKSDIDIYLEGDKEFGFSDESSIKSELEEMLMKDIDVVTESNDKSFMDHLHRTKIVLYERRA